MMFIMPLLLVFVLLTQLMRGVGDTLLPLYALIIQTAVSCVMTPAFVRGWGGLPQLGVISAAAASTGSFSVALAWFIWPMTQSTRSSTTHKSLPCRLPSLRPSLALRPSVRGAVTASQPSRERASSSTC
jgi:Na+-driven multidrug efflux pump